MELNSNSVNYWIVNNRKTVFEPGVNFARDALERSESIWEREIWQFVVNWFDEHDYIEVNTSGSTGKPSVVKLSKAHMKMSAMATLSFLQIKKHNFALLCLPANYIAGKMMIVRAICGNFNILAIKPAIVLEIPQATIDFAAFIPAQVEQLIITNYDFRNISVSIIGGAAISAGLAQKISELPNKLYSTYGMTETITHIALQRLNGSEKSDAFSLLPGFSVEINHDDCLLVKTPYAEEYIKTSDVVKQISENEFIWLGRADFVINSGGVKIFPEFVERKLSVVFKMPFFVFGLDDEKWGKKLVLFIEISFFLHKVSELKTDFAKCGLSKIEWPREIFVLDKFVYTENFKIDRIASVKKGITNQHIILQ